MSARLVRVATTPASCPLPESIVLRVGDTLSFGRSKGSDVVLDSTIVVSMISRTHAKLVWDASTGKITLFDLNSTNGVYLNDRKIDMSHVRSGDRITFGGRGRSVPVGQIDPQPGSEFIYELRVEQEAPMARTAAEGDEEDDEDDGDASILHLLRTLTDNVQLLITWLTAALLAGSYLFAPEGSEEFSFASGLVAPLFALLHIPFTRVTFTVAFVLAVGLLLGAALWIMRREKELERSAGKGKGKKKAQ